MRNVRLLNKDEIECRVQSVKQTSSGKYVELLLYKTARTDMQLLDETFGYLNWQDEYRCIDGKMYCTISVYDDSKKEWIKKENVGTESNMEAEKGQASDAMKRAGFLWGIGTELYSAPKIRIWEEKCNITKDNKCYDKFIVSEIEYDKEKETIKKLVLVNDNTDLVCFVYDSEKNDSTIPSVPDNSSGYRSKNNSSERAGKIAESFICEDCKTNISEKVAKFSKDKYGKCLCMSCQKKNKTSA